MKIWRYWLTETRPLRCESVSYEPCVCNYRVTVGSNVSESDARERLEAVFAELVEWYGKGGQYNDEDAEEHRRRLRRRTRQQGCAPRTRRRRMPALSSLK